MDTEVRKREKKLFDTWKIPWSVLAYVELRNDFKHDIFSHYLPFEVVHNQLNIRRMEAESRGKGCSCHDQ